MNIALQDLLTTDTGLLSLAVIVFIIGMGGYLAYYVRKHIADEEAAQAKVRAQKRGPNA